MGRRGIAFGRKPFAQVEHNLGMDERSEESVEKKTEAQGKTKCPEGPQHQTKNKKVWRDVKMRKEKKNLEKGGMSRNEEKKSDE